MGTGRWVEIRDPDTLARALDYARGDYQRNLLRGYESLSGSTLKGKARKWSGAYKRSRDKLLARLREAGIKVAERRAERGRRVLVLGAKRRASAAPEGGAR